MTRAEALIIEFEERGRSKGGDVYFPINVAGKILERCEAEAIIVLGVEAFEARGEKIMPRVDMIADFSSLSESELSWGEKVSESIRASRVFLSEVVDEREDMLVSFVLKSQEQVPRIH